MARYLKPQFSWFWNTLLPNSLATQFHQLCWTNEPFISLNCVCNLSKVLSGTHIYFVSVSSFPEHSVNDCQFLFFIFLHAKTHYYQDGDDDDSFLQAIHIYSSGPSLFPHELIISYWFDFDFNLVYFCFICYQPYGLLYIHDSIQLSDFSNIVSGINH
jgi:hypothetical protein